MASSIAALMVRGPAEGAEGTGIVCGATSAPGVAIGIYGTAPARGASDSPNDGLTVIPPMPGLICRLGLMRMRPTCSAPFISVLPSWGMARFMTFVPRYIPTSVSHVLGSLASRFNSVPILCPASTGLSINSPSVTGSVSLGARITAADDPRTAARSSASPCCAVLRSAASGSPDDGVAAGDVPFTFLIHGGAATLRNRSEFRKGHGFRGRGRRACRSRRCGIHAGLAVWSHLVQQCRALAIDEGDHHIGHCRLERGG